VHHGEVIRFGKIHARDGPTTMREGRKERTQARWRQYQSR
jgi:hypothetical protein